MSGHELATLQRAEIDAALVQMAQDPDYQAEVLKMEAEFAFNNWDKNGSSVRFVMQVGAKVYS